MNWSNRPEIGIGAALVFLPPLVSMMLFSKRWGMEESFKFGVNISFVLMGIGAVVAVFYVLYKVIGAVREAKK